jgi:SAM-dependent methyltransferase
VRAECPLSLDHPDSVTRIREVLDRAGYTEAAILEMLELAEIPGGRQRIQTLPLHLWRSRGDSSLETLVRLFLLNQPVPLQPARQALAPMPVEVWAETGLLTPGSTEVRATVELVPYQGLLLTGDWSEASAEEPVMGVGSSSRALAQFTVRRPVQRALDLGSGCGIQAFLAARHSDQVLATELNPRAISLARFNAALNGLANVEFLPGDWFAPVREQQFDLIVCNPPFVIGPGQGRLHTRSDRTSDQLCREIIQAAPSFLREGGYFQLVGNWVQPVGQDWRQRLAGWFEGSGCDAWGLHSHTEDPPAYAFRRINESTEDPAEVARLFDEWMACYQGEGIEGIGFGVITLRRSTKQSNWVRFDHFEGVSGAAGAAVEQGFALRDFLETNRTDQELLDARLCHAPHLCWEQRHEVSAEGWSAVMSRLRTTEGLGFVGNAEAAVAEFVVRCRGDRPLSAYLAEMVAATGQDRDRLIPGFLKVVRRLLELGYLLPAQKGNPVSR